MELKVIHLSKYFRKEVVKNVEARPPLGMWSLLGANGVIKSIMMKMMDGNLEPPHGQVAYCKNIRNNGEYRVAFGFLSYLFFKYHPFSQDIDNSLFLSYHFKIEKKGGGYL